MSKMKSFQISDSLAQGLEETVSAAQTHSGQLRIDVLPIKKIELDPENPRELSLSVLDIIGGLNKNDELFEKKQSELNSLQSLAESIKREGVINPIIVYKYLDKYRVVAGERRMLASVIVGNENIQAKILDKKPNEQRLSFLQWIENVERENLSLWERLRNLDKIINANKTERAPAFAISPAGISSLIGCSIQNATNYFSVLFSDQEIKEAIKNNKIRNLEKAALVSQIKNSEIKTHVLDACINGASLKGLKKIVQDLNMKNKEDKMKSRARTILQRGRIATQVSLGTTKNLSAVKFIIKLIAKELAGDFMGQNIAKTDWNNYSSVTNTFKQVLVELEKSSKLEV